MLYRTDPEMQTFTMRLVVLAALACSGVAWAGEGGEEPGRTRKARAAGGVVTNSIGMKLVKIPPGEFVMGSHDSLDELAEAFPDYEADRIKAITDDPPHKVRITKPFSMGAHEVTIGQFK